MPLLSLWASQQKKGPQHYHMSHGGSNFPQLRSSDTRASSPCCAVPSSLTLPYSSSDGLLPTFVGLPLLPARKPTPVVRSVTPTVSPSHSGTSLPLCSLHRPCHHHHHHSLSLTLNTKSSQDTSEAISCHCMQLRKMNHRQ